MFPATGHNAQYTVTEATIDCEQFEPDMFVSIVIDISSTDQPKGEFEVKFLDSNQNGDNYILKVQPNINREVRYPK